MLSDPTVGAQETAVATLQTALEEVAAELRSEYQANRSKKGTPQITQLKQQQKVLREERKTAYATLKALRAQVKEEQAPAIEAHQAAWNEQFKAMRQARYLTLGNRERLRDNFQTALIANRKKGAELREKYWPPRDVHFTELYFTRLEMTLVSGSVS